MIGQRAKRMILAVALTLALLGGVAAVMPSRDASAAKWSTGPANKSLPTPAPGASGPGPLPGR